MRTPAPRSLSRFKRAMNRSGAPAPASLPTAVQHALYVQPEKQKGLALIELLLIAGVILAGTAVVFGMYSSVAAKNKTRSEAAELQQLTRNVLNSYSGQEDFGALNTTSAMNEGLFPKRMVTSGSEGAQSSWGNEITLSSVNIDQGGTVRENWGFSVNYANIPEASCIDLVGRAGSGFSQVKIEGTNVREDVGINVNQTAELCARPEGADVSFIYTKPGSGSTDGPLELCSPSLPPASTQTLDCPGGQYGAVTQTRSAFCVTPYDPYQWTPWTTTSDTCTACPASTTETGTQWVATTGSCAAGTVGQRTWEYQQTRARQITYNCPAGTPTLPPPTTGAWSAWVTTTPSVTRNLVNTCATCPPDSTITRTVACTDGNHGVQNQSQTTTYNCPVGTITLPTPIVGAWTNTTNTCKSCPAPSSESRTVGCPAGQYGSTDQKRSVTYDCSPAPTTLPAPIYGSWTNGNSTCSACPAPSNATQTQWVAASGACPTGQMGSITWQKAQTQSRTVTYSCPANTSTLPSPIYGAWGAWSDTGATRNVVSSCVACPSPESNTRSLACPTWQTGAIGQTQTRTFNCPAATWNAWSAWSTTSNTCALPACGTTDTTRAQNYMARYADLAAAFGTNYSAAYSHWINNGYNEGRASCWGAPCVLPNPSLQTEGQTVYACPAGQYGTVTQHRNRTASCPTPTTPYTWSNWSGWVNVANTCAACPQSGTQGQTVALCPAGQYGTVTQHRAVTYTCPAGSATWTTTIAPWTTVATACSACPAAAQEAQYQWVNRSAGCPAGQAGTNTWQAQQVSTRTRSYTCPAGSTGPQGPNYSGWSGWSDTGATQSVVNTCAPTCAPKTTTVYENTYCTGTSSTVVPGRRFRTAYWTCPGPTITSYSGYTVESFPQCCPAGRTCQIQ